MSDEVMAAEAAAIEQVKPKRIFLTGGQGMLGSDFLAEARRRSWEVIALPREEWDLTSEPNMRKLSLREWGEFDWVVNCAAYTAVDQAETDFWTAQRVNGIAPGTLSFICQKNGWRLLHMSTDYVFNGQSARPYLESDPTGPIGKYGQTKLFGEEQIAAQGADAIICRTAWLFGPNGRSFPRSILEAEAKGNRLTVVNDQFGNPTYTVDLARVMADLIEKNVEKGIVHAVGPDGMSWHEFALRVLKAAGRDVEVTPVPSADYPSSVKRPQNSRLDTTKLLSLGIAPMRPIDEALAEFVQRLPKAS